MPCKDLKNKAAFIQNCDFHQRLCVQPKSTSVEDCVRCITSSSRLHCGEMCKTLVLNTSVCFAMQRGSSRPFLAAKIQHEQLPKADEEAQVKARCLAGKQNLEAKIVTKSTP